MAVVVMVAELRQDSSPEIESSLIRKAKAGDKHAFSELVRIHQKLVYNLVYRFCRDHDTADELAQEAFVKAYVAIGNFREGYRFASWISTIATNLALNHLRRAKRTVSTEDYPVAEIIADPNPGSDPARRLSDKELEEKIEEAVENLPLEFKAVFILRVHDELSYEEIAERLGIEMGTVMSRLFRARSRLKKDLEEYL